MSGANTSRGVMAELLAPLVTKLAEVETEWANGPGRPTVPEWNRLATQLAEVAISADHLANRAKATMWIAAGGAAGQFEERPEQGGT